MIYLLVFQFLSKHTVLKQCFQNIEPKNPRTMIKECCQNEQLKLIDYIYDMIMILYAFP